MADQAQTLRELAQVRADNRDLLNAVVGNQGTALGRKNFTAGGTPSGDPCIIIYMPHKIANALLSDNLRVPSRLSTNDGRLEAATDVVVTTLPDHSLPTPSPTPANQALINTLQWRDGTLDHLPPGAQVGGAEISPDGLGAYFGTLGVAVRERLANGEIRGFLTNQHVGGTASRSMYIPGAEQNALRIGVTRMVREHYPDDQWIEGVNEKFAYVRSDAAFVAAEDGIAGFLRNDVPGVGPVQGVYEINLDSMDLIGLQVKKVGRTTGLTTGTVVAFGHGITNANEFIDRRIGSEPANVYTDLLIAPNGNFHFSAPGDSGSLILADSNDQHRDKAIGLLWGGRAADIGRPSGVEDVTYGIDLNRILKEMNLELI